MIDKLNASVSAADSKPIMPALINLPQNSKFNYTSLLCQQIIVTTLYLVQASVDGAKHPVIIYGTWYIRNLEP